VLRDVFGAWIDAATEREFDAPLLALLASQGFSDIHLLHGAFEFGKDAVAKRGWMDPGGPSAVSPLPGLHQWALQSKAGDIGLGDWREIRHQLDEARLDDLAHPSFDLALPRVGVLVLTGRLKGGAAVQAQSYRESERRRGRPDLQVWDRETLLDWLVDSPGSAIAGMAEGPLLGLLASVDAGTLEALGIERYARRWLPDHDDEYPNDAAGKTPLLRAAVEASVIGTRLRGAGRCDLAALVALALLRAVHAAPVPAAEPRRAALGMFAGYAGLLLDAVEPLAADPRALLGATVGVPLAHVPYMVVCQRLVETLGLLGLLGLTEPDLPRLPSPQRVTKVVADLAAHQPGVGHLAGDAFAVSLLAPVVLLAREQPVAARALVVRATVWLADRHDPQLAGNGLAPVEATADEVVRQLLSGPLEDGPTRRTGSYAATVLIDLAALLQHLRPAAAPTLYGDVLNDTLASGACPELVLPDGARRTWRPDDRRRRLLPLVRYTEPLPADGAAADHHHQAVDPGLRAWDVLAMSSVTRDRHDVVNLVALATAPPAAKTLILTDQARCRSALLLTAARGAEQGLGPPTGR